MSDPTDSERTVTDEDIRVIVAAVSAAQSAPSRFSRELRDDNHQWVLNRRDSLYQTRTRRQQIWDKTVGVILAAGVLGFLGFLGHAAIAWLGRVVNGGP